jgi:hypothetical protein
MMKTLTIALLLVLGVSGCSVRSERTVQSPPAATTTTTVPAGTTTVTTPAAPATTTTVYTR